MSVKKGLYVELGGAKSTQYLKNLKLPDGLFKLGNSKFKPCSKFEFHKQNWHQYKINAFLLLKQRLNSAFIAI